MRYAWLGLPLLLLAFVLGGVFSRPTELFAYSRDPSGSPVSAPIEITVASTEYTGDTVCAAGNYVGISFYDGSWYYSAARVSTESEEVYTVGCADMSPTCTYPVTVQYVHSWCSVSTDLSAGGNYVLESSNFELTGENAGTPPAELADSSATLRLIEENANAITFGIAMLILLVGAGAGWFSIKNT